MSALVKYLGSAVPVGEMVAARSVVGVVTIALIAWRTQRLHLLRTRNWQSHAMRSSAGALAMFTWILSLTRAPIADATAMVFMGPVFATLLAPLLLREPVRAVRWLAVALGFGGVFIMTGPRFVHTDNTTLGLMLALLCALFTACSMIFLRQIGRTEHALTTTFYFCVATLLCAAVTAAWGWPMPSPRDWLLLLLIGLLGTLGQFLMTAAFSYAEASIVVPVEYSGILVAALLGYVFFGEIPGISIWIGAPLVVGAGLLIVWSEYKPGKPVTAIT